MELERSDAEQQLGWALERTELEFSFWQQAFGTFFNVILCLQGLLLSAAGSQDEQSMIIGRGLLSILINILA